MRPYHRTLAGLAVLLFFVCTPAGARRPPKVDISEILDPVSAEDALTDSLLDLVLDPTDVSAHIQLANLYARGENFDLAERAYRRALKLDRDNAAAWNNLGVLYLRQQEVGKALSCFDEAIDSDPRHALAHYNMGSVLDGRGEYDQAIKHYRIAFDERPELAEARSNPFVVYNLHTVPAILLNYLSRENYALLVDSPRSPQRTRVVGIAEEILAPGR